MRFFRRLGLFLLSSLVTVGIVVAQDECPAVVDDALFSLNDLCLSIGRNEACYGNGDIVAVPVADATLDFDVPGDTAAVDDIASVSLSPFSGSVDDWGIAVLVVQADIPDTLPGQNVTMLLFGDVSLSTDSGAYYFTAGIGAPDCNQAPDGMLIQTPEGAGEVNLTMNGINISIGSTAFFGSGGEGQLFIALLEGEMALETEESSVELEPDFFTVIDVDEDGNATGDFSDPDLLPVEVPEWPTDLLPIPLDRDDEDDSDTASGGKIIPQSGAWLTSPADMVFGETCPVNFADSVSAGISDEMTTVDGSTADLDFSDGDILGPLFLDLAEAAFQDGGATLTTDEPGDNTYIVTITFEGGSVIITQTYTVVSDVLIEAVQIQEYNLGVIDCTVETNFTFEYAG